MIPNLDQTPSKFVPGCNKTLAEKGSKSVPITGSTDKLSLINSSLIGVKIHVLFQKLFFP